MTDRQFLHALRLAAEYTLLFSKDHPEIASSFPESHELLPYMIAVEVAREIEGKSEG